MRAYLPKQSTSRADGVYWSIHRLGGEMHLI
jgi:hypothetical protein